MCRLCSLSCQVRWTAKQEAASFLLALFISIPRGLCKWTTFEANFPHLTCLKICIVWLTHTYIREVLSSGIFWYLHLYRLYSCLGLIGVPFKSRDQLSFIKLDWLSRPKNRHLFRYALSRIARDKSCSRISAVNFRTFVHTTWHFHDESS